MTKHGVSRRQLLKGGGLLLGATAFSPISWGDNAKDVIVIGAGLSGLYAADLLQQAGLSVTVLEGNDRIGGRIFTYDDVPGRPEVGGQTIGPIYGRTIYLAMRYGLELGTIDFSLGSEPIKSIYDVGGKRILPASWGSSPQNPFPSDFKSVLPDRLLNQVLGAPPFEQLNDWLSDKSFSLDYPVADLLKTKGFDQASINMMGVSNNYGRTLEESSTLFLHRNNKILYTSMQTPGGLKTVKGGNQRLPEAMAANIKDGVKLNKKVIGIEQLDKRVVVSCADGSKHSASYVISSIPFSTLRSVEVKPGLPVLQAEAVKKLAYGQVFQAHFSVKNNFWQGSGFMPNLWSDSIIERVFASDPEYTGEVTNLTVWINGKAVEKIQDLPESEARKIIEKEFYRVLPEAKGNVRLAKLHSWDKEAFACGSYAVWSPGQVSRYATVVSQPSGRLHFAGEHTAQWGSGMEGALESGERAALEIIERVQA